MERRGEGEGEEEKRKEWKRKEKKRKERRKEEGISGMSRTRKLAGDAFQKGSDDFDVISCLKYIPFAKSSDITVYRGSDIIATS